MLYFPAVQFLQDCAGGCQLATRSVESFRPDEAEERTHSPSATEVSNVHSKIYTPIKRWQTRLLRLLPGTSAPQIEVELHVADLIHDSGAVLHDRQELVEYTALSYCWGPVHPPRSILCDKIEMQVTPNLHSALKQLRGKDESLWLWVDALCINQMDVLERSMQVEKMLLIYYKAASVLVWLGPAGEHTGIACEALKLFEPTEDDEDWSTSEGSEASVLDEERALKRDDVWEGPVREGFSVGRASAPPGGVLSSLGRNREPATRYTEQVFDRTRSKRSRSSSKDVDELSPPVAAWKTKTGKGKGVMFREPKVGRSDSPTSEASWESESERSSVSSFKSDDSESDEMNVPPATLCFEHARVVKNGLIDLLNRSYFERVWVMQEVWAASNTLVVTCGPHGMPWGTLLRASKLLSRLTVSPSERSARKERYGRLFSKFEEPDDSERLALVSRTKNPRARFDYYYKDVSVEEHGYFYNSDIVSLLNRAHGSQCTDPRDHIYALLGMSTDRSEVVDGTPSGNVAIPVSYDRSTAQTFQDVMRYVMHRDGGLWILLTASAFGGEVGGVQLPSWCRDWRTRTSQGHAMRWIQRLDRERRTDPDPFLPSPSPVLEVSGVRIAFVPEASDGAQHKRRTEIPWQPDHESAPAILQKWTKGLRWFLPSLPKDAIPGDSAVLIEVSKRVLAPILLRKSNSRHVANGQAYSYIGPVIPARDFSDLKDPGWPDPWTSQKSRPKVAMSNGKKTTYAKDVGEKDLLDEVVHMWRRGRGDAMTKWSIV